jgi:hypothetical protein
MARPRAKNSLTQPQLDYLAGVFESTIGLRGVGTNGAVGISNTEAWPKYMANTYGGISKHFTASRTEKTYWGWYLTINKRLALFNQLRDGNHLTSINPDELLTIQNKMEKSINSGHGNEGE